MAHITSFEDMQAWQKSRELSLGLYKALAMCPDRSFKDQIQRASVSIMNNLAEGFERGSDRELIQYLYIAKGSAGEVRSMLSLADELNYLDSKLALDLSQQATEISKMTANFIKSLKKTL